MVITLLLVVIIILLLPFTMIIIISRIIIVIMEFIYSSSWSSRKEVAPRIPEKEICMFIMLNCKFNSTNGGTYGSYMIIDHEGRRRIQDT